MKNISNRIMLLALQIIYSTLLIAQPAPVKKVAQSVFAITTFRADGSIHSSSYGAFVGPQGEAVAMWHIFDGAERAVVVDAKGQSHEVDVMMGVSELYDLCRFKVKDKTPAGLQLTTADAPVASAYVVDYDLKKFTSKKIIPLRSEKFMNTYNYYVFNDVDVSNTDLGCPLVDDKGMLLGIMQRNKNGGQAFAADARLITTFTLNGLSLNDNSMRATGIRTALPDDQQQAMLTLMLAGQQNDSAKYEAYIKDFIQKFPTSTEGYKAQANRYVQQAKLDLADKTFEQELKNAAKKDEAYHDYAIAMYRAVAFRVDSTYNSWSFARALTLAKEAEKINPLPIYKHLQAQIIYAQGDYQQALNLFTELQKTDLGKHGEVYYEAAQCKQQLKAPQSEIMTLLDSAVNVQKGAVSAPYVLARAQVYDNAGEYRKAFLDYHTYDSLMSNRASHEFYYAKFKCETKIRQYQLALNDIAHAIVLNRYEPTYYAEMASLQLQLKQFQESIKTCDLALQLTQNYADLYIIKGIAQCELKNKAEGLATLRKAGELGDERAPALIEKYNKKK